MAPDLRSAASLTVRHQSVHGHDRAYVLAGSGPPLLLLHGVGSSLRTWDRVLDRLARDYTVIAPDLLGHGESAKPRADYSLGGYANGMRDLLSILDVERVSVIGHSFGGGVAMQFAYQYPERCERVVLVGTGGLGHEVTPLLRAMTIPGAGPVLAGLELPPVRFLIRTLTGAAAALPALAGLGLDLGELGELFGDLASSDARWAFQHVLRAALDPFGQVVTMLDRSYLAAAMPVLLIWGSKDRVVPVSHASAGQRAMPGSKLEIFEGAGHFPHRDEPARFVSVVRDFLSSSAPASYDIAAWRRLLRAGRADSTQAVTVPAQSAQTLS